MRSRKRCVCSRVCQATSRRLVFDDLHERAVARGRRGRRPPHPVARHVGGQQRTRAQQRRRRQPRHGLLRQPALRGGGDIPANRDDEKSGPRLRREIRRVDHHRADAIAQRVQRGTERGEIGAPVRGERADDVFERKDRRRPALARERAHEIAKGPERARTLARQPRLGARERQVLTGKRGPGEIGMPGQVRGRQGVNVADREGLRRPSSPR